MIATHEEAVIAFTTDREELIKESRQNELYGEQIIQIIKSKCPSILGKLQPFVEDIQSNYKLTVQLTGRITRAEAARAEAKQLGVKTREVCEQKIKAPLSGAREPRLGLSETAFITGRVHHFRAIYLAEEINTQRAVHDRGTNQRCRVIVAPVERDVTMATMETFTLSFTIHIS